MYAAQFQDGLFAFVGYRNFRAGLQWGGSGSAPRREPRVIDVSHERLDRPQAGAETRAVADAELAPLAIGALTPQAVHRLERPAVAYKPSLQSRRSVDMVFERAPSGSFIDTAA